MKNDEAMLYLQEARDAATEAAKLHQAAFERAFPVGSHAFYWVENRNHGPRLMRVVVVEHVGSYWHDPERVRVKNPSTGRVYIMDGSRLGAGG